MAEYLAEIKSQGRSITLREFDALQGHYFLEVPKRVSEFSGKA